MEFQSVHTSASELQRQEREDRLRCRCDEVWQEHPGQGVRGGIAARLDSGIAADTSATQAQRSPISSCSTNATSV